MPTRVLVLSDTHLPGRGRFLPPAVLEEAAQADLVVHAGDLVTLDVYDELALLAPVVAVHGNVDDPEACRRLPARAVFERDGVRVGVTHGHLGRAPTTPGRALEAFAADEPRPAVVIFGHSHQPLIERREGVLLLNPGSPTDPRRAPAPSYAWLELDGGEARARLVELPRRR
ncbi:metallophosphoesterase [Thermaerobacter sp. FW80]|uniref:metallophosphoesterase family protein n=1 Tax=Thermaerobacter sp. FW80 TaxID=2546351 RepID=UPI000DB40D06|nr:metallophosphoesterase [Thermaerobacter sp. FW80]PZN04802.1 MAG: metallophosphoesterase [Bacillota bacterium]QBS37316.1 metallophosphoesterase [Thermaerobacter sp. FW80]